MSSAAVRESSSLIMQEPAVAAVKSGGDDWVDKDVSESKSKQSESPDGGSAAEEVPSASSSTSTSTSTAFSSSSSGLAGYQKLITDPTVRRYSLYALRYGIFADAVTGTILQPNYAVMARPGATAESFPTTAPFDANAATYFIPMAALLGVSLSCLVSGPLSDRMGRKNVLQACMGGSVVGTALKWVFRKSFWGFCAANFANGLVSGGLPVAMAYLGDVFPDPKVKQAEFGIVTGAFVLGNSVGGIVAILMEAQGLFAPLWVGVGLMAVAVAVVTQFLVEPRDLHLLQEASIDAAAERSSRKKKDPDNVDNNLDSDSFVDDLAQAPPTELNCKVMWNIIGGAFADNVGSNGLFPICLSPLAFEQFYENFVQVGLDPVLSLNGYKWISVLVALVVIPSTVFTPWIFNQIGPAGGCVFGNVVTAALTVALLFLGSADATSPYLAAFVTVMYCGFPFTVVSQLSTGPMLDRIAPPAQRGYVQGISSVSMNVGTAIAPWVLGVLADQAGTEAAIWTGVAVSLLAAAINAPLLWVQGMGPPPKPAKEVPPEKKAMKWEDGDVVDKLLRGEYVPGAVLDKINEQRKRKGLPYLLPDPGTYAGDMDRLHELLSLAREEFAYESHRNNAFLREIATHPDQARLRSELAEGVGQANEALRGIGDDRVDDAYEKLGQWFADHVRQSGYHAHVNQMLLKQMILVAFPRLLEVGEELTPDNVEQFLANKQQVFGGYAKADENDQRYSLKKVLGNGQSKVLYG